MDYYTSNEITHKHNVSAMTVSRWISNAKSKKNALMLFNSKGKSHIIRNGNNEAELKRLSLAGKGNKPKYNLKITNPVAAFYKNFTEQEILAIINSLETASEIDHKYSYINGGAAIWDRYYLENVIKETNYPTPIRVENLLKASSSYLDFISEGYSKINVFDVGPGNALLVINFLKYLNKTKRLERYVALDISSEMNAFATKNVLKEFPDIKIGSRVIGSISLLSSRITWIGADREYLGKGIGKKLFDLAKSSDRNAWVSIGLDYPHIHKSALKAGFKPIRKVDELMAIFSLVGKDSSKSVLSSLINSDIINEYSLKGSLTFSKLPGLISGHGHDNGYIQLPLKA